MASDTSVAMASASPPFARISSRTAPAASARTSATTTRALSPASASAAARPIPLPPPVTIAVFPASADAISPARRTAARGSRAAPTRAPEEVAAERPVAGRDHDAVEHEQDGRERRHAFPGGKLVEVDDGRRDDRGRRREEQDRAAQLLDRRNEDEDPAAQEPGLDHGYRDVAERASARGAEYVGRVLQLGIHALHGGVAAHVREGKELGQVREHQDPERAVEHDGPLAVRGEEPDREDHAGNHQRRHGQEREQPGMPDDAPLRSEEHTSELQSL